MREEWIVDIVRQVYSRSNMIGRKELTPVRLRFIWKSLACTILNCSPLFCSSVSMTDAEFMHLA